MQINDLINKIPSYSRNLLDEKGVFDETGSKVAELKAKLERSDKIATNIVSILGIFTVICTVLIVIGGLSSIEVLRNKLDFFILGFFLGIFSSISILFVKLSVSEELDLVSALSKYKCSDALELCAKSELANQWREWVIQNRGQILGADFELMKLLHQAEKDEQLEINCKKLHGIS